MSLAAAVLDLLIPHTCAVCGEVTREGLCEVCADGLPDLALPSDAAATLAPGIVAVGAYAYEGVIRKAIHSMKIGGRHAAARPLGRLLRFELGLPEPSAAPWEVAWVPSTPRTRRQRGVEIPRLLAGPGAVSMLRRTRHGADQTALSAAQRRVAPSGAFRATRRAPPRVVLVDDVRTTGATALAAATALRDAGAEDVLVVTLAVAQ